MKVEEAKKKWCCDRGVDKCIANECMAWRWNDPAIRNEGYCGLCGKEGAENENKRLLRAKQPDTPPMTTPGTATSATHYQLLTQQPIEIMQTLMTHEQFIGFLWGNCIKYALRLGHKDDTASDAGKLAQYARWLAMVENGETIKP